VKAKKRCSCCGAGHDLEYPGTEVAERVGRKWYCKECWKHRLHLSVEEKRILKVLVGTQRYVLEIEFQEINGRNYRKWRMLRAKRLSQLTGLEKKLQGS